MLEQLRRGFPDIKFAGGNHFAWSPKNSTVYYDKRRRGPAADWSLLHETGHALLGHQNYGPDFELLQMEIAAWQKARQLAADFNLKPISEDHIEDCLDSYRDWLNRRSLCPACGVQCLQTDDQPRYHCHNCGASWRVSPARFSRSYRSQEFAAAALVSAK